MSEGYEEGGEGREGEGGCTQFVHGRSRVTGGEGGGLKLCRIPVRRGGGYTCNCLRLLLISTMYFAYKASATLPRENLPPGRRSPFRSRVLCNNILFYSTVSGCLGMS